MGFLDPRNLVVDGPDAFCSLIVFAIAPSSTGAEGSPIYTTIDADGDATGSWSDGTWDYTFTGSGSIITQRVRQAARDQIIGVDISGENYEITRKYSESSWADIGIISGYDTDKFYAEQGYTLGCNGGVPPFAPPIFRTDTQIISFVPGLRTNILDPSDTNVTSTEIRITPPYFTGSIQDGDLKMVIRMDVWFDYGTGTPTFLEEFLIETDCSSWTTTDFRDIRGAYGETSIDVNGITYTWSITIG